MTKKEIGCIVTAFTGKLCIDFPTFHSYAEELLGRPIYTHEFASEVLSKELREKTENDFIKLAKWCSGVENEP
jgi:hypothetical protein